MKPKWFAYCRYPTLAEAQRVNPMEPNFVMAGMMLFVGPTMVDPPNVPPTARMLGRVRADRSAAIQEALDYLKAELVVASAMEVEDFAKDHIGHVRVGDKR